MVVIALPGAGSVVGVEADRSISELQCEVRMTGARLLGGATEYSSQGLSTQRHALWCHLPLLQSRLLALPSALPQLGNADNQLGCLSATALIKLQCRIVGHRSDEVRHWDQHNHEPGPAVGTMGSVWTLVPPPHAQPGKACSC